MGERNDQEQFLLTKVRMLINHSFFYRRTSSAKLYGLSLDHDT